VPKARPETQAAYLREGWRHLDRARAHHPLIADPAEALVTSIEAVDGVLKARTIGVYRAQLKAVLATLVQDDTDRLERLVGRVESALQRRRGVPERPRTSSRKRKSIPQEEVGRLLAALAHRVWAAPADHAPAMLALALFVHSQLGHRGIEGAAARLDGHWLVLRNAKANADRAGAPERRIDLSAMGPLVRRAVVAYLRLRDEMVERYDGYENWYRAASERLGRLCESLAIERVAFSSLRHVSLATWKRAGLAPFVIAALAGHSSRRSAGRYYAGAGGGWALEGLPRADATRVLLLELRAEMRDERRARANGLAPLRDDDPRPADDGSVALPEPPPDSAPSRRPVPPARHSGTAAWAAFAARQSAESARWTRPSSPPGDAHDDPGPRTGPPGRS